MVATLQSIVTTTSKSMSEEDPISMDTDSLRTNTSYRPPSPSHSSSSEDESDSTSSTEESEGQEKPTTTSTTTTIPTTTMAMPSSTSHPPSSSSSDWVHKQTSGYPRCVNTDDLKISFRIAWERTLLSKQTLFPMWELTAPSLVSSSSPSSSPSSAGGIDVTSSPVKRTASALKKEVYRDEREPSLSQGISPLNSSRTNTSNTTKNNTQMATHPIPFKGIPLEGRKYSIRATKNVNMHPYPILTILKSDGTLYDFEEEVRLSLVDADTLEVPPPGNCPCQGAPVLQESKQTQLTMKKGAQYSKVTKGILELSKLQIGCCTGKRGHNTLFRIKVEFTGKNSALKGTKLYSVPIEVGAKSPFTMAQSIASTTSSLSNRNKKNGSSAKGSNPRVAGPMKYSGRKGFKSQTLSTRNKKKRLGEIAQQQAMISPNSLAGILKRLNIEKYATLFLENQIDAQGFSRLTDTKLTQIGITAVGPRVKIMREVQRLAHEREKIRLNAPHNPFFESQSDGMMAPSWYEIKRGANQEVHLSPSSATSPCCSASHTSNGGATWGQTMSSAEGGPLGNNSHSLGARVLFPPQMERSIQEQIQHFQQKLHHFQQHPTSRSTNFNYSPTTPTSTVTTPHDYTPLPQQPSSKMGSYPSWQFPASSSTPFKREHSSGQASELNPSSSSIGEIFPSAVTLDPLTKLEYYPAFLPYPPDDDFNIPIPIVDCGSTQAIPSSATTTTPSLMESLATPGTNLELFSDIQDFPTPTGMQFNLSDYLGDAAMAPPSSLHSSSLHSYKRSRA